MTWYPVSDHQTDKASYSFAITVPEGKVAVANGVQSGTEETAAGWTTWYWDAPDQQASYLTTASVGDFDLRDRRTLHERRADHRRGRHEPDSGPPRDDERQPRAPGRDDRLLREPLRRRTRSSRSGRSSTTTPSATHSRRRPARSTPELGERGHRRARARPPVVRQRGQPRALAGHLAQRGLGDVRDVDVGRSTTAARPSQEAYNDWYAAEEPDSEYWDLQIGDPGALGLFQDPVYDRGAGTLHASEARARRRRVLRRHPALARALRRLGRHGRGLPGGFEEVSGEDLDDFFQIWLYDQVKPPATWTLLP